MCSHSQQANNARSGTVHSREGWTIIIHVIIRSHVHCINAFIRMETLSISRCGWMRVSVHSFVDLPSPPMAHFSSHQVRIIICNDQFVSMYMYVHISRRHI